MLKRFCLAFLTLMLMAPATAVAEKLVREFSGHRSQFTAEFQVEDPWLIDWRVNSDYPSSMGIAVTLVEAKTDAHAGQVFKTKSPGDGLRLVNESGVFRFKVDASVTRWTLKVIQLNREEAKLYTPKETD
jgi:hypothetical protein